MRLHEKGGRCHDVPANYNLNAYLAAQIKGAGLEADPKRPLFRTAAGKTGALPARPMSQVDAYPIIRRRAIAAGIGTKTAATPSARPGSPCISRTGWLETAQHLAAHESACTTGLYDRCSDDLSLDEVERIAI